MGCAVWGTVAAHTMWTLARIHPLRSSPNVKHMGNEQMRGDTFPWCSTQGLGAVASLIWGELAAFSSS